MEKIKSFTNEYDFLSNFYLCNILYEGITYPSAETAFQASKCVNRQDRERFQYMTPGEAKKTGKKITLRPDWEYVRVDIMREIINIKFSRNFELAEKLRNTGNMELIEGNNWHDNFWGDCGCKHCQEIPGQNTLGKLLMEYRAEIPTQK